jgi:hypothetical protein
MGYTRISSSKSVANKHAEACACAGERLFQCTYVAKLQHMYIEIMKRVWPSLSAWFKRLTSGDNYASSLAFWLRAEVA